MPERQPPRRPVIWARLGEVPKGPRPAYSHQQIAEAAVDVADAEGLERLSMRKVAARLGMGAMSLYRYVASKEELIDLMVDRVRGESMPPDEPAGGWREELRASAWRSRSLYLRHPWIAGISMGRSVPGPNALAALERLMARLEGLGLDIDSLLDMGATVEVFVAGFVQFELAEQEAQRRTGLTEQEWRHHVGPYMGQIISDGQHPAMERIVVEAEDYPDTDTIFERRLGFVLDGLAAGLNLA